MSTRAERCLKLLITLFRDGQLRTSDAARLNAVDARLAREDMKLVRSLAPLRQAGRGRAARWVLDPGFGVRNLGLLDRISLVVGRQLTGFLQGTQLHAGLARVGEDQVRELPLRYRAHFDRKLRFQDEPARLYAAQGEAVDAVLDGLLRSRSLSFRYAGSCGEEPVEAEPWTLLVYRRALYVVGGPGEPRLYALDRMRDVTVGATFTYPDGWDPDAHFDPLFGVAPDGPARRVVLRFTAYAARYVRERRWHGSQQLVELPDGGVELHLWCTGLELRRFALEWGEHCEVVEPQALRDAVVAELENALAVYRGAP